MFANIQRIHFVGIGGIGMSGIAEVLLTLGYKISGSDLKTSPLTQRLARLGASIFEGHDEKNIAGAEVVVISSAIAADNPEVAAARRKHVPVIPRAEMLAELMRLKYGIAVAGMHGKTTTTSMIAAVLAAGGLDPTMIVGGRVDALDSNARLGKSQYLVAEADESDRSFLRLSPILAVITNLDREHMDCYRDLADVQQTFLQFIDRLPFYGTVVLCNDDDSLRALLPQVRRMAVTYGTRAGSEFQIKDVRTCRPQAGELAMSSFSVCYKQSSLGNFELQIPGAHNVLNAAAAIAVGVGLELKLDDVRSALHNFRGVDRRFHFCGRAAGVSVVDDYGHHPTEIRATLAAARECGYKNVHVVFQPHRYTRTQLLLEDFATAFAGADTVHVLDVYAASEAAIPGVNGQALARVIRETGHKPAEYAVSFAAAAQAVVSAAAPGDLVLTLGAGNVSQLAPQVLAHLQRRVAR